MVALEIFEQGLAMNLFTGLVSLHTLTRVYMCAHRKLNDNKQTCQQEVTKSIKQ